MRLADDTHPPALVRTNVQVEGAAGLRAREAESDQRADENAADERAWWM